MVGRVSCTSNNTIAISEAGTERLPPYHRMRLRKSLFEDWQKVGELTSSSEGRGPKVSIAVRQWVKEVGLLTTNVGVLLVRLFANKQQTNAYN